MRRKTKRGFTIIELVIVVAVIAILAAVLIPTFASLIKKAKMSADQRVVREMNLALEAEEIADQEKPGVSDAFAILREAGFNVPVEPSSSGYQFYWIAEDNRVVLVEMDSSGKNPKTIVFPEELAKKYGSSLPGEWYTLKPEEVKCNHLTEKGYEYVPIALETGGSKYHMVICKNCNEVLAKDAPHDTLGTEGSCSKCGFKEEKDSTTDPCVHSFPAIGGYTKNEDGTHTKTCKICNNSFKEECTFDIEGQCVYCNYKQVADGHQHHFTYEFTGYDEDNTTGYHSRKCSEDGCPSQITGGLDCSYAYKNGGYYCIYCERQAPQNFKIKQNLVDGYYYRNNRLFTGTKDGYQFEYGKLVIKDENPDVINKDSDNLSWQFTLPDGSDNTQYLTDKVVLRFSQNNAHFKPGRSTNNKIVFSGGNEKYTAVDIKVNPKQNVNGAVNMLNEAIKNGETDNVLALIKEIYGFDQGYYPILTHNNFAEGYFDEVLGITLGDDDNLDDNALALFNNRTITYSQWLKNEYSVDSLLNLPASVQTTGAFSYPYNGFLGGGNKMYHIVDSEADYIRFDEPEYVLWYWNFTYSHVYWYGISNKDTTELYNDSWSGGVMYGDDCKTLDWKKTAGPKYDATLYSDFELYEGISLENLNMTDNTFYITSGTHLYFMTNAWQDAAIVEEEFEIMLNKKTA